ncbi:hypothetical protein F5884DRAFT_752595 [Xylogone sp. PMI_703]|nr:hypothetical protein F5884DRAFT_752595 [Xylogone sp. PMI_703]
MAVPTHRSHEQAFMVQKYMLLSTQHDALQKRLAEITSSTSTNSSPSYSPERGQGHFSPELSSSPTDGNYMPFARRHHRRSSQGNRRHLSVASPISPRSSVSSPRSSNGFLSTTNHHDHFINPFDPSPRRSSLPSVLDESILSEIEADEHKLRDVNLQIKTTLTDLLNCEHVRCDSQYRTWVQERLMNAEMELRGSRSRSRERRVSGTSEDVRRLGYL